MRILLFWDDASEADLINMYLNPGEDEETTENGQRNESLAVTSSEDFYAALEDESGWDVFLLNLSWEDPTVGMEYFKAAHRSQPDSPIVGACRSDEVIQLAGYITQGLRSYLIRDEAKDYIFLIQTTLESAVEAVKTERERIISGKLREEIDSVRRLQESILPEKIICPEPYTVSARYESSQIRVIGGQPVTLAGGDYYDVFALDDTHVVILVGDASGHGMRACMSIMTMHTLVSMIRNNRYEDTSTFVAEINKRLCNQRVVTEEGFITLLYGILDTKTHEFQWTSAGHPIPMTVDLESGEVTTLGGLEDGGLPLGIYEDAEYDLHTATIPPNSRLLVYSDGLEEAFPDGNRDFGQYGIEGIEESLSNSIQSSLDEAMQALFDDSHEFTNGSGRHDDTSIVLMERTADVPAEVVSEES